MDRTSTLRHPFFFPSSLRLIPRQSTSSRSILVITMSDPSNTRPETSESTQPPSNSDTPHPITRTSRRRSRVTSHQAPFFRCNDCSVVVPTVLADRHHLVCQARPSRRLPIHDSYSTSLALPHVGRSVTLGTVERWSHGNEDEGREFDGACL